MASLILIGGILLAVKIADEHDKNKARKAFIEAEDGIEVIPPYTEEPPSTESTLTTTSRRSVLSRKYWYERRKSKKEAGEQTEGPGLGLGLEAPPPYEMEGRPVYRDLPLDKDEPSELDSRSIRMQELPGSPTETELPTPMVESRLKEHE
ncbi:uncharacterized protein BDV14DRAFT_21048 [Aspergillus stella-maris]|uniref:uncharacterized protein n=1 Tax=Aspergillus stella-maris TaxID=1810926 RepID=UPI003CCCB949